MPETCVSSYHCGTHAPGWLRGAHPDVSEGVVSRTVCFTWRNNCCSWRSTILVRNCGDFYVYKLQRAPKCKLRYCGVGVTGNGRYPLMSSLVCIVYFYLTTEVLACKGINIVLLETRVKRTAFHQHHPKLAFSKF